MTLPNYVLIKTSCLFLLPAIYGYYNSLYTLSMVTCITSLCSINYWRYPIEDWRLVLDKTMATSSCIIYVLFAENYIQNTNLKTIGYFNWFAIIYFYVYAKSLYSRGSPYWINSHIIFHFFVISGKILVLYGISETQNEKIL
jgi:hypothetical protein